MNRRDFLTTATAAAGALALDRSVANAAEAAAAAAATPAGPVNPYEVVPLGKTGLKVSRIGMGTGMRGGNRQSNHTRMGFDAFKALVRGAFDRGVNFFDLADMYGTHQFFARAMAGVARERYVINTKMWVRPGGIPERERPDSDVLVDRFRKELDTDYIDLVLIHCMEAPNWPEQQKRYLDSLAALKAKGIIKAHGVSIHCARNTNLGALHACAESPWVDSVHARINAFGDSMCDKPENVAPVLKKIHDAGKGVVGMKLVGEGRYRDDPAKRDESIRYVLGLGAVDTMIVGFEKIEEVDDFAKRVAEQMAAVRRG